jgi:hypothetical protein
MAKTNYTRTRGKRGQPVPQAIVARVGDYLSRYVVLPETSVLVVAAWVVASRLTDEWDQFPHLAITSPEKRCGKTTLLDLLYLIVPRPRYTTNISPAALYRLVELERPTLLMDEYQSVDRRGSESSEVIREMLNAGIRKNAKVIRCGGPNRDQIEEFAIYSPKVFAKIGDPDGVLADRCVPVRMKRQTKKDRAPERFRSRNVEAEARVVKRALIRWTKANGKKVAEVYASLEPFGIDNDRMADLLQPLQAVLTVDCALAAAQAAENGADGSDGIDGLDGIFKGSAEMLPKLRQYADELEQRNHEAEMQSPGVQLLIACREIIRPGQRFISTDTLLECLRDRREEPWYRWNKGEPIGPEGLARLLRPYGIKSSRDKRQTCRGYYTYDFEEPWQRYLPALPLKTPSNSSNPSTVSARNGSACNGKGYC